ncbi:MAG: MFS transporter, partial [Haliea sp.]
IRAAVAPFDEVDEAIEKANDTEYRLTAGFFSNAGIVGMYAILAQVFPTHVRAFGTGFAVGFGRGGSVLSPIIAGFLLQGGLELPTLAIVMGTGSLLAACVLLYLKLGPDTPSQGGVTAQEAANVLAGLSKA